MENSLEGVGNFARILKSICPFISDASKKTIFLFTCIAISFQIGENGAQER